MIRAKKYNVALTKEDDVRHLGKVFVYTFVEDLKRKPLEADDVSIRQVAQYFRNGKISYAQKHLVSKMIDMDDTKIVDANYVRKHFYFWSSDKIIRFLKKVIELSEEYATEDEGEKFIRKAQNDVFELTDWREFKAIKDKEESDKIYKLLDAYKEEIDEEIDENNIFDLIKFILYQVGEIAFKVTQMSLIYYISDWN